ncbi:hypothetical protein [Phycicoccus sp. HDW14]|nr:hypothetical protein [Phycicoccus sp. HDW14]
MSTSWPAEQDLFEDGERDFIDCRRLTVQRDPESQQRVFVRILKQ